MSAEGREGLPRALVVDDEQEVADAYALRLRETCDVATAYSGEAALSHVEEQTVDVVLLDRHMPGQSGDDVLAELDATGFVGRVVMVTAIDPGFDVLDMPFHDYICKPVDREDLRAAVRQQCEILGYQLLGEYFGAESKRRVIDAELPPAERDEREEYQVIEARARDLERRARRLLGDAPALLAAFDDVRRT